MYLGFDTSNYTTSLALFDGKEIFQSKKLLSVKEGEKGLRQSDALFQHTVNLPELVDSFDFDGKLSAVGVSAKPRNIEGSYMPCFLAGVSSATALSKFCGVSLYKTSHQVGHILAALYSADILEYINKPFIALHLSGGTTEVLYVTPDNDELIKAEIIAESLDLKAGQAIDRTGVLLGMKFPCGAELDGLSRKSDKHFKYKVPMKGCDCSMSGIENKVKNMISSGSSDEDVAKFVIDALCETVNSMLFAVTEKYGELPIVFSGGVSSNSLLREYISSRYNAYFAHPSFSCDNAAGVAIYAYLKDSL